jgi:hypothetical protein
MVFLPPHQHHSTLQFAEATVHSIRSLYAICRVTVTVFGFPQTIAKLRPLRIDAQTDAQFTIHLYLPSCITLRNLRPSPPVTIVVIGIIVLLYYSCPVRHTFCSRPVYTIN